MISHGLFIFLTIFLTIFLAISIIAIHAHMISLKKKLIRRTEELNEEKKFLNYVLEATNTNINITDTEFNLQYVDPTWQKVYGNPAGRKCYEYFMNRNRPCETCGIPEAIKYKKVIVYEELMPSENNRIVEVHTIPFQDSHGKWLVAEFNVDITRRKKAEEAFHTKQRLDSLGILAGGIAHDFNNLLTGIFSNINIAAEMTDNSDIKTHLNLASESIERTRNLTGQLLTFSKGGSPVKRTAELIPYIQETVNFALSGSKVTCSFAIADDLKLCEFDKNQIGQVIDNLVINAQQAMNNRGELTITAENVSVSEDNEKKLKPGDYIRISVRDSGCGIPQDVIPKIFDPFFTTKEKGAGLGLATSFSIVKRHGGTIVVQSKEGEETTFSVYLPAATGSVIKNEIELNGQHSGKGTFVIMDDQDIIRMTTGKIMENLGYTVFAFEDGEKAVDFFRNSPDDISGMIFDLTIPGGMGGAEAASIIREIDKDVPILVSSGYADDPVMAQPKEYGFTGSITKPFTKEELMETLNRFIKN